MGTGIGTNLKGNADSRKFAVKIEVPLRHQRIEIAPHAEVHGRTNLPNPAVLENSDGGQEPGNREQHDVPE
jgi:hypothetical protein